LWKNTVVLVFKKGDSNSVKNYRPISVLSNFPKIFEIFVHNHLSNLFKHRINPPKHGFRKCNSITTNLVNYLNSILPSVCTKSQIDSVYLVLSSSLDIFSHNIVLHKLSNFGLSSSYAD
jgi:hypothetical protein